ncbi:MAG: thioredoxin [Actinobacteria bacterium]|nr:thioredoxin [Actinomycetota bacterium]NDA37253.1 thioredoxin [Acidimicrobiia bacterium]NDC99976.1 thioredoxin [bacterium]HBQ52678.1 thioredoxin [Acidimicrobium sp.]NBQ04606.1 thioredoxin [Actinomycetota bacterium]
MAIDVTDATFQKEVIEKSKVTPVIIDLWAQWCGPCKTLGPILEKLTAATNGKVILAKVDVDSCPQVAQAFQVQSIPAVYAMKDGKIVDGFVGAQSEHVVEQFIKNLLPEPVVVDVKALLAKGDEASLRQALAAEPTNESVVVALADLLIARKDCAAALELLKTVPETERVRTAVAAARAAFVPNDDFDKQLTDLLVRVKTDEDAKREFLEVLEKMGPNDPRTGDYRKKLTARLF